MDMPQPAPRDYAPDYIIDEYGNGYTQGQFACMSRAQQREALRMSGKAQEFDIYEPLRLILCVFSCIGVAVFIATLIVVGVFG